MSLIVSTLCFNAHVRLLSAPELQVLQNPYMRAVRRIGDKVRFSGDTCSGFVARQMSSSVSIDCIVLRQRLLYVSRFLRKAPAALIALLCAKMPDGRPVSLWTRHVVEDLSFLYDNVTCVRFALPDPRVDANAWSDFMTSQPQKFKQFVHTIICSWSVCDKVDEARSEAQALVDSHVGRQSIKCTMCPLASQPCFKTFKALQQHQRISHGARTLMRYYANADGVCSHCGTCFQSRLRLLRHLTDTRRPRCAEAILGSGAVRLSDARVEHLDLIDTMERRRAQRQGHSHPIAIAPARIVTGQCIGRVQR